MTSRCRVRAAGARGPPVLPHWYQRPPPPWTRRCATREDDHHEEADSERAGDRRLVHEGDETPHARHEQPGPARDVARARPPGIRRRIVVAFHRVAIRAITAE